MYISFTKAGIEAILAGEKTATAREWTEEHARRFRLGGIVDAYRRSPRVGGKRACRLLLTWDPVLTRVEKLPDRDYIRMGYRFEEQPFSDFEEFRQSGQELWVIRFRLYQPTS